MSVVVPEAASRKKVSRITIAIVIVAIVAASSLTYLAFGYFRVQETINSKETVSIKSVSLRANSSPLYYPTLFASVTVSSALNDLAAFVDGVRVYDQYLSQQGISAHDQGFGIQVKNVSVALGRTYTVSFRITFDDGVVRTVSESVTAKPPPPSYITVEVWTLCSKNCVYPSPFFEALVTANSSVPLASLQFLVNGTSQEIQHNPVPCCLTSELWKSGVDNKTMPIIAGKTYSIEFVATFQDDTTYTATKSVVAG